MKCITVIAIALSFVACGRSAPRQRVAQKTPDVQTIDSSIPTPAVLSPPPVLTDEGPAPRPVGGVLSADAPPPPTPQDEALRASLPYAPAIALDPVDGSKISIRAHTPMYEYKGHFYYFASEANKRTFAASPDPYMKGVFAH